MAKILIVDDEPAVGTLLRIKLLRAGYDVEVADSVSAAKEACMLNEFDAVLSDVIMPDGNGHELMHWIARNRPTTATALMTGFDIGCERCPYSPRCKLIAKPFNPDDAIALIRELVEAI